MDDLQVKVHAAVEDGDVEEILRLAAILDEQDRRDDERLAGTTNGEAAWWYAEHGIAVFPLQPRGKLPATAHGFKDATTDLDQVLDWWRATPAANVGLPTGHLFDVIDIDGPDGMLSWARVEGRPPVLGHALTPRPGGNHIYVPPTGHGNRAAIHPGIDYRGVGGYVVAPPSATDDHGRGLTYRWIRALETETT